MKGDFSRSTFDPRKHYRGVRMQQGRVQLDADWNESLDVLLHRIETETLDVIGECGIPEHQAAFGVVSKVEDLPEEEQEEVKDKFFPLDPGDFLLTRGRAYVDGILVEMEEMVPFSQQPYAAPDLETNGVFALYLDVWERLITAVEDPSIRETALGGPDTAVRSQVIWQAALATVEGEGKDISCATVKDPFPEASDGMLCARTTPSPASDDPCTVAPGAGYKRLENQLYRVEIHSAESGKETFKWSRENGSIMVKIDALKVDGSSVKLQVASLGRDDVLGFHESDNVEVIDEAHELAGEPGLMAKIVKIDPDDNVLTLDTSISGFDDATARLRRWESGEVEVADAAADYYLLDNDGVEIQFQYEAGKTLFHTGDYWQIPARTVPGKIGTIEWPNEGDPSDPTCLLPFGIQHHYCKLAIITIENGKIVSVEDCREKFPPLTELPGGKCCCSVTVGLQGDYADLQAAIDDRPNDANVWHICLEPGIHQLQETVEVANPAGLVITGCQLQTFLKAPEGKPAMVFGKGKMVRLEGFRLSASSEQGALIFNGTNMVRIAHILAENFFGSVEGESQPVPVVVAAGCQDLEITENTWTGKPVIQAQGKLLKIHKNRFQAGGIQILPGSSYVDISDNEIMHGTGPGIQFGGLTAEESEFLFTEMEAAPEYYAVPVLVKKDAMFTERMPVYNAAPDTMDADLPAVEYVEVQEAVETENVVISLGEVSALSTTVVRVTGNTILHMQGSGILTKGDINDLDDLGDLEDVIISGNRISECGQSADLNVFDSMQVGGGIVLTGIFNARIMDNVITENGGGNAACGVYLLDGGDIEISGNSILENGASSPDPEGTLYQAGIGGHFLLGNLLGDFVEGLDDVKLGYPALRVHGNEVVCPAGPALSVIAAGSVLVEDNSFATCERRRQPALQIEDQSVDLFTILERGLCVTIINLGIPVYSSELNGMMESYLQMIAKRFNIELDEQTAAEFQVVYPDGRVLFSGNQVNFRTAETEPLIPEGLFAGLGGSMGLTQLPMAQLLFTSVMSTFIFSLDDAVIQDNQFRAMVPQELMQGWREFMRVAKEMGGMEEAEDINGWFIHVASIAMTARATGNSIAESHYADGTALSYGSVAIFMNTATNNQVTHILTSACPIPYNNVMIANRSLTMLLP